MKITIDEYESFPVYQITSAREDYEGPVVELSDAEYEDYMRVRREYSVWQGILKNLYRSRYNGGTP